MNCDECRELIVGGDADAAAVRRHLDECADCRSVGPTIDTTAEWLARRETWATPGDGARERFLEEFRATRRQVRDPGARRWAIGAVAAVAVVAVAIAGVGDRPDWSAELSGTDLDPLATAMVDGWSEGGSTRVRIRTESLPPAPDGSLYELWFSGDRGIVSAGTFTAPDDVELNVGVRRRDFPRIWVTLEPIDGDPAPSGATVLTTG